MRRSVVTWHLTFLSGPTGEQLATATRLLGPSAHTGPAPNYDQVHRGMGLAEYQLVEPPQCLDAGELALACLTKAHRIGRGWAVMWPPFPRASQLGWWPEDVHRAKLPEALHDLAGWTSSAPDCPIDGLYAVGFSIAVLPPDPPVITEPGPLPPRTVTPAVAPAMREPPRSDAEAISRAVIAWIGPVHRGTDERRVVEDLGPELAASLMPRLRALEQELHATVAPSASLTDMAARATAALRAAHPELSEDAIAALVSSYTYSLR